MNPEPLPDHPLRLLHLGDSYTIGEGVTEDETWPAQLRQLIEASGHRVTESRIIAQNGWTTADLLQAFREADLAANWDLITLCIGVNNQYQGRSVAEFQHELGQLLDKSKPLLAHPHGQMLLLSLPDWSITPFAEDRDQSVVSSELDHFNQALQQTATTQQLPFLDWTPLTRRFKGMKDAFAEDGLHPTGQQHTAWAQFLVRQLVSRE